MCPPRGSSLKTHAVGRCELRVVNDGERRRRGCDVARDSVILLVRHNSPPVLQPLGEGVVGTLIRDEAVHQEELLPVPTLDHEFRVDVRLEYAEESPQPLPERGIRERLLRGSVGLGCDGVAIRGRAEECDSRVLAGCTRTDCFAPSPSRPSAGYPTPAPARAPGRSAANPDRPASAPQGSIRSRRVGSDRCRASPKGVILKRNTRPDRARVMKSGG